MVLVLLACSMLLASWADAYVLNDIKLRSSRSASRLVLTADSTLKFRVDLEGPQIVVLHLPGAHLSTDLPEATDDPLIAEIRSQVNPDGLTLVVTTRTPGVTVLPSYEAMSRRLTLEFGGPPTYEQSADSASALPPADPDLSLGGRKANKLDKPAPNRVTGRISEAAPEPSSARTPQEPKLAATGSGQASSRPSQPALNTAGKSIEIPPPLGVKSKTSNQSVEMPPPVGMKTKTDNQSVNAPPPLGVKSKTSNQSVEMPPPLGVKTRTANQSVELPPPPADAPLTDGKDMAMPPAPAGEQSAGGQDMEPPLSGEVESSLARRIEDVPAPNPEPMPMGRKGLVPPPPQPDLSAGNRPEVEPTILRLKRPRGNQASGLIPPPPPDDEPTPSSAAADSEAAGDNRLASGAETAPVPAPQPEPVQKPRASGLEPEIQTGQTVTVNQPRKAPQSQPAMGNEAEPRPPLETAEAQPDASLTPAPLVLRIRRGTHPEYTRVVLDGSGPMSAQILPGEKSLVLSLERGDLDAGASIAGPDWRTQDIKVIQKSPLRLQIDLKGWLSRHKLFYLAQGRKVVLDFDISIDPPAERPKTVMPSPANGPAQPDPAKSESQSGSGAEALEQASAAVSPQRNETPRPAPETAETASQAARDVTAAPAAEAAQAAKPVGIASSAKPKLGDMAQAPPPQVTRAIRAKVHPLFRSFAQGGIPPVPTPPPLARPRGPVSKPAGTKTIIGPSTTTAAKQQPSPQEVIQKVAQAESAPAPAVQTAQPSPEVVQNRPPQAAYLGEAGKQDIEATRMFEIAKAEFDNRRYQQALQGFEEYLKLYPKHRLAGEATFRLADAFFNQHERNFQSYYPDAMKHYQKGIDLYPDSDQVPWALLMMGRAAMLGGEPFKAAGYFEVVIQDYPKSEYVPLALVQRAQAYLAEGKINRALEEFRLVSERFPNSRYRKDADWGQAQALFNMSRFQRASLLLKDMDRRDPELRIKEPELLYYIGEAEFQLKNYPDARSYFLWALNIMPNLPDADIVLTRVGDTYKFEGDHNAAKDIYRRVVNTFPDTDGALVSRIRLAEAPAKEDEHPWEIFKVQATTDAFKTYREIATKYPEREVSELARLKLGVYYYKKKQYELAMDSLQGLMRDHPQTIFKPQIDYTINLVALGMMDQFHAQNKPMELMNAYLQFRSALTRPNGDTVLGHLAWAYEQNGWFSRAAKLYETLLERGVNDPATKLDYARVKVKSREFKGVPELLNEETMASYEGARLTEARSILGRAYQQLGEPSLARAQLRLAVADRPMGPGAAEDYYALGRAQMSLKEPMEALAAFEHASSLLMEQSDPPSRSLNYLICMDGGAAAMAARRVDKSGEFYKNAAELGPSPQEKGQALYMLAESQKQSGQMKEAIASWQNLAQLGLNPWSEMAQRHLADMQLAPSLAQVGK